MEYAIRAMAIEDYEEAVGLWRRTDGVVLSDSDERGPMGRFLDRNPGLSLVAEADGRLVGALLCSHDGRRGYLHHLAVDDRCRRRGIGSALVREALSLLGREGIAKCNIFILEANEGGIAFWQRNGFRPRPHCGWMQKVIGAEG